MPHAISQTQKTTVFNELEAFITDIIENDSTKPNGHVALLLTLHSNGLCLEFDSCSELIAEFWQTRPELNMRVTAMAA